MRHSAKTARPPCSATRQSLTEKIGQDPRTQSRTDHRGIKRFQGGI
ncbi:MAG: hypothetical protein MZV64_10415 [Ignavibacteriales bacterium]|nr:hypothetical protein [Ignavibacteriales bacterium]